MFIIAGVILVFGALFYAVFGSGHLQSWAAVATESAHFTGIEMNIPSRDLKEGNRIE